jgi:hypothetical protein
MGRFSICATIGASTAVILTYIRGGFADAPYVVIVFGLAGFSLSYLVAWLSNVRQLGWLERNVQRMMTLGPPPPGMRLSSERARVDTVSQ